MHELYLKVHEPAQYALLIEGKKFQKLNMNTSEKFFVENFNMTFDKPKSDPCQKSDKLIKK